MEQFFANNTILALVVLWSLPWKGVALWKAARLRDKWWFIVMLVVNLVGLLEILYIFFFSKRKGLVGEKSEN